MEPILIWTVRAVAAAICLMILYRLGVKLRRALRYRYRCYCYGEKEYGRVWYQRGVACCAWDPRHKSLFEASHRAWLERQKEHRDE